MAAETAPPSPPPDQAAAQLGARIGLDGKTVTRYITLLEQLFPVRHVPAWSVNALARVVKTPKLQFLDSGLLSALLGLRLAGLVTNRTAFSPALECYVYAELLRLASWSEDSYELFMYRDKDQLEVDVVIANRLGQLVGVEVKSLQKNQPTSQLSTAMS